MRKYGIHVIIVTIATLSSVAWANTITPVFAAKSAHLFLGNAVIGIIEGLLISLIWKSPKFKAMGLMILANYFSMIIGVIVPDLFHYRGSESLMTVTIYNFQILPFIMVPVYWAISVIAEWPYCTFSVKKGPRRWKSGLLASLLVQTVSYAVLIVFYCIISTTPKSLGLEVTPAVVTENKDPAWIYFLRENGLYRIRLNGMDEQKLESLNVKDNWQTQIWAAPDEANNCWDLYFVQHDNEKVLMKNFAARPSILSTRFGQWHEWHPDNWKTRKGYPHCGELRPANERDWEVYCFGNYFSFSAHNEKTGQNIDLVVDTPFTIWQSRECAIALPGDKAIAELSGRIILIDLNGRRIGQITTGFSPVVVWEGPMKDSWTPKDLAQTQPASQRN